MGDLSDYITDNVAKTSVVVNHKPQTPEGFISKGVKSVVYQYVRILENHGCSLLAHPDFSMFFVHLQCKVSNNILIFGYFQC